MSSSHIYILRNKSFKKNVLKIGKTINQPDFRAKQIYSGATGIPEPFDVLFACSVADCDTAEIKVHRRLAAYRVNNSREFFCIPISVARKITLDVCMEINIDKNHDKPVILIDRMTNEKDIDTPNDRYEEKLGEILSIPIDKVKSQPIDTSILSKNQKERISLIAAILSEVYPDDGEKWHSSFSRDTHPEGEIRIWEHIAKAFLKIDDIDFFSIQQKKEAYTLLLERSLSPTKHVLRKHKLKHFEREAALKIMAGYELAPKPITVKKIIFDSDSTKTIYPTPIAVAIRGAWEK